MLSDLKLYRNRHKTRFWLIVSPLTVWATIVIVYLPGFAVFQCHSKGGSKSTFILTSSKKNSTLRSVVLSTMETLRRVQGPMRIILSKGIYETPMTVVRCSEALMQGDSSPIPYAYRTVSEKSRKLIFDHPRDVLLVIRIHSIYDDVAAACYGG